MAATDSRRLLPTAANSDDGGIDMTKEELQDVYKFLSGGYVFLAPVDERNREVGLINFVPNMACVSLMDRRPIREGYWSMYATP